MAGTSSSASLARALEGLEPTLADADLALAEDLFGVLAILDANAGLRRALTDPARSGEDKAALVDKLVMGRVSARASRIAEELVTERWSGVRDLGDALEQVGATVVVAVAEQGDGAQGLDRLEDELFSFITVVASNHALQRALSESQATDEAKIDLALKLVPEISDAGALLITQAVRAPRGLKPAVLVERFLELVAARQQRWIANVTVPRPLLPAQLERLEAGLDAMYGRDLKVNVTVDPALIGGVRVSVGDEVVDSTVVTRLSELRRKLAG